MDPFNKLPPELHMQILLLLHCKSSVFRLAQASPVILQQYFTSKPYITRKFITADFDDEMVQDAMGIILLPSPDPPGNHVEKVGRHFSTWSAQHLPNPLKTGDDGLIGRLHNLQNRLLLFIEDYLTKATASFPPREYLCLPDLSSSSAQLMFKDRTVGPTFDAAGLTVAERKRLLRAFLRYELICSMSYYTRNSSIIVDQERFFEYSGQKFRPPEREAIRCVDTYIMSLYTAMFAQCSNSWLPEERSAGCPSESTGLLFPDTVHLSLDAYARDMGLGANDVYFALCVTRLGFDIVAALIRSATAGERGRSRLERWFKDLLCAGSYPFLTYTGPYLHLGTENPDMGCKEAWGMYRLLSPRLSNHYSMMRTAIYQQRAWVFFDDDRFYPSSRAEPHFPTYDELKAPFDEMRRHEEWFNNPGPVRALRRSQKWHDEREAGGDQEDKELQDSGVNMAREVPLPDTSEKLWFQRVPRFWS